MPLLSVNIDHVATVRNARYPQGAAGGEPAVGEPDPVRAAHEAELGGADGVTVHLREDRRHIVDDDVQRLRGFVRVRFNLEMAATDEMVEIALRVRPHTAMFVPEGRMEVTTEGGLDVLGQADRLKGVVSRLKAEGVAASAFIDADPAQAQAAAEVGFGVCEIHTGPYAHAFGVAGGDATRPELARAWGEIKATAAAIRACGMRVNAGHALNYANVGPVAAMPGLGELHIGHAIVSRAVYVGMRRAVAEMIGLIRNPGVRFE